MPRKRTLLTNADAPPETLAPRTAVADPDGLSDDVERVLAELGEGASSVAIYREDDSRPGKFDFVARVPAPEFSNDYVATQYGGGNYRIIVTDANQGPLNAIFFSVDRRIIGKAFRVTEAPHQGGGEVFKDRLLEILLARALTPAPAPAPVVQQNTGRETLEIIAALAPLLKGNGGGGMDMEGFAALMGAVADMAGRMQPADGLAGVAASLLPAVSQLVTAATAATAARRLPAPPPRVLSAPAPVAASAETTTATTADVTPKPAPVVGAIVPEWLKPFHKFAGILVNLADTEADPNLYADVCVDQLSNDEGALRSAVEAMNAGTLKDDVLDAVPALKETEIRRDFVTQMVARVEEGLREVLAEATEASNG